VTAQPFYFFQFRWDSSTTLWYQRNTYNKSQNCKLFIFFCSRNIKVLWSKRMLLFY